MELWKICYFLAGLSKKLKFLQSAVPNVEQSVHHLSL